MSIRDEDVKGVSEILREHSTPSDSLAEERLRRFDETMERVNAASMEGIDEDPLQIEYSRRAGNEGSAKAFDRYRRDTPESQQILDMGVSGHEALERTQSIAGGQLDHLERVRDSQTISDKVTDALSGFVGTAVTSTMDLVPLGVSLFGGDPVENWDTGIHKFSRDIEATSRALKQDIQESKSEGGRARDIIHEYRKGDVVRQNEHNTDLLTAGARHVMAELEDGALFFQNSVTTLGSLAPAGLISGVIRAGALTTVKLVNNAASRIASHKAAKTIGDVTKAAAKHATENGYWNVSRVLRTRDRVKKAVASLEFPIAIGTLEASSVYAEVMDEYVNLDRKTLLLADPEFADYMAEIEKSGIPAEEVFEVARQTRAQEIALFAAKRQFLLAAPTGYISKFGQWGRMPKLSGIAPEAVAGFSQEYTGADSVNKALQSVMPEYEGDDPLQRGAAGGVLGAGSVAIPATTIGSISTIKEVGGAAFEGAVTLAEVVANQSEKSGVTSSVKAFKSYVEGGGGDSLIRATAEALGEEGADSIRSAVESLTITSEELGNMDPSIADELVGDLGTANQDGDGTPIDKMSAISNLRKRAAKAKPEDRAKYVEAIQGLQESLKESANLLSGMTLSENNSLNSEIIELYNEINDAANKEVTNIVKRALNRDIRRAQSPAQVRGLVNYGEQLAARVNENSPVDDLRDLQDIATKVAKVGVETGDKALQKSAANMLTKLIEAQTDTSEQSFAKEHGLKGSESLKQNLQDVEEAMERPSAPETQGEVDTPTETSTTPESVEAGVVPKAEATEPKQAEVVEPTETPQAEEVVQETPEVAEPVQEAPKMVAPEESAPTSVQPTTGPSEASVAATEALTEIDSEGETVAGSETLPEDGSNDPQFSRSTTDRRTNKQLRNVREVARRLSESIQNRDRKNGKKFAVETKKNIKELFGSILQKAASVTIEGKGAVAKEVLQGVRDILDLVESDKDLSDSIIAEVKSFLNDAFSPDGGFTVMGNIETLSESIADTLTNHIEKSAAAADSRTARQSREATADKEYSDVISRKTLRDGARDLFEIYNHLISVTGSAVNQFLSGFLVGQGNNISRLFGVSEPMLVLRKALQNSTNLAKFMGKEPRKTLDDKTLEAYQSLLDPENGNDISVAGLARLTSKRLGEYLDGLSQEQLTNLHELLDGDSTKVLNFVVQNSEGKYSYDPVILEVASLAAMQFTLVSNQSKSNYSDTDLANIAEAAGVPMEALTPEQVESLERGSSMQDMVNQLSGMITSYLGLTRNMDAPIASYGAMQALAIEMIRSMEDAGIIESRTVEMPVPEDGSEATKIIRYDIKPARDIGLGDIRVKDVINQAVLGSELEQIRLGEPFEEYEKVQLNNERARLTKAQSKVIENRNKTKHSFNIPMIHFLTQMGIGSMVEFFADAGTDKYVDGSGRSTENRNTFASRKGKRDGLHGAFYHLQELMLEALERDPKDRGIFFQHMINAVGRIEMRGSYTPVSSKLWRVTVMPTQSSLDMSDSGRAATEELVLLSVAQLLGIDIGGLGKEQSLIAVEALLADEPMSQAVELMQNWLEDNENLFNDLPDAYSIELAGSATLEQSNFDIAGQIKELMDSAELKMTPESLFALMELARFRNHKGDGNFETNLYIEADGVTNGIFNTLVLFAKNGFSPKYLKNLAKGGLYVGKGKDIRGLSDIRDILGEGEPTLYDESAKGFGELVRDDRAYIAKLSNTGEEGRVKRSYRALSAFLNLVDSGSFGISESGISIGEEQQRDLIKHRLIGKTYGSSAWGMAQATTKEVLDSFYEELSRNDISDGHKEVLVNLLYDLIDSPLTKYYGEFRIDDSARTKRLQEFAKEARSKRKKGDYVNFTLTSSEVALLRTSIQKTISEQMVTAIDKSMAHQIKNGRVNHNEGTLGGTQLVRKGVQLASIIYATAFETAVNEKIAQLKEDGLTEGDITRNDIENILDDLEQLSPTFATDKQTFRILKTKIMDQFDNLTKGLDGKESVGLNEFAPTSAGVAGIAYLVIGLGDGAMMTELGQNDLNGTLGVHDGWNIALGLVGTHGETANRAVSETLKQNPAEMIIRRLVGIADRYNLVDQIDTRFDNIINKVGDDFTPEELSAAVQADPLLSGLMDIIDLAGGKTRAYSQLTGIRQLNSLRGAMKRQLGGYQNKKNMKASSGLFAGLFSMAVDTRTRQQVMSETESALDQMAGLNAPFRNTGTEYNSLDEAAVGMESRFRAVRGEHEKQFAKDLAADSGEIYQGEEATPVEVSEKQKKQNQTISDFSREATDGSGVRIIDAINVPKFLRTLRYHKVIGPTFGTMARDILKNVDFNIVVGTTDQLNKHFLEQGIHEGIMDQDGVIVNGFFDPATNTIYLRRNKSGHLYTPNLVHELVHAATHKALYAYYSGQTEGGLVKASSKRLEILLSNYLESRDALMEKMGTDASRDALDLAHRNLMEELSSLLEVDVDGLSSQEAGNVIMLAFQLADGATKASVIGEFLAYGLTDPHLALFMQKEATHSNLKRLRDQGLINYAKEVATRYTVGIVQAINRILFGTNKGLHTSIIDGSIYGEMSFQLGVIGNAQKISNLDSLRVNTDPLFSRERETTPAKQIVTSVTQMIQNHVIQNRHETFGSMFDEPVTRLQDLGRDLSTKEKIKLRKLIDQKASGEILKQTEKVVIPLREVLDKLVTLDGETRQLFNSLPIMFGSGIPLNSTYSAPIHRALDKVLKNITPETFLGDLDVVTEQAREDASTLYDLLTGRHPIYDNEGFNQGHANGLLIAAVLTNPTLREALRDVSYKDPSTKLEGSLNEHIERAAQGALEGMSDFMAGQNSDASVVDALDSMVLSLALDTSKEYGKNSATLFKSNTLTGWRKWLSRLSQMSYSMDRRLSKTLTNIGEAISDATLDSDSTVATVVGQIGSLMSEARTDMTVSTLQDILAEGDKHRGALASFVKAIYGRTESNKGIYDMIKQVVFFVQEARQEFRVKVPLNIQKKFNNVDSKVWSQLYKGIGQTDLTSVMGLKSTAGVSMTAEQVMDLISDPKKLKARMDSLEREIKSSMDAKDWAVINAKMNQLANYLNGGPAGTNLLRNAAAIANGVNLDVTSVDPSIEASVDALVSLRAFDTSAGKEAVLDQINKNREGLAYLLNYMNDLRKYDKEISSKHDTTKYNHQKGYIPQDISSGTTLILAEDTSANAKDMAKRGWKRVGTYEGAKQDGKKMAYFFNDTPIAASMGRGILQNVEPTVGGVRIETGLTHNSAGSRILDPREVRRIRDEIGTSNSGADSLIPVFDGEGNVIAYERAMDQAMRDKYLSVNTNLPEMVGAWRGRQVEEKLSDYTNAELLVRLKNHWDEAISKDQNAKKRFIDISDPTKLDPVERDALKQIPQYVLDRGKELFGGSFMVPKEMIDDVIGRRNASVGDLWTGTTRLNPDVTRAIKGTLDIVLGDGAYRSMVRAEQRWQGVIAASRDTIIVRNVFIPAKNFASNVAQLVARGIPLGTIMKELPKKVLELQQYTKMRDELIQIEMDIASARTETAKKKLRSRRDNLKMAQKKLSIWPLINRGEFNTLADVGLSAKDMELVVGDYTGWVTQQVNKLPPLAADLAGNLLMTPDSPLYKGMAAAILYGDFISKAVLHDYYTKRLGMEESESLGRISEEYVNYDRMASRTRGYLENVGLLWFFNWKLRITKTALNIIHRNPLMGLVASFTTIDDWGMGLPIDENIFAKLGNGKLKYSMGTGMLMRSHELHQPLSMAASLLD